MNQILGNSILLNLIAISFLELDLFERNKRALSSIRRTNAAANGYGPVNQNTKHVVKKNKQWYRLTKSLMDDELIIDQLVGFGCRLSRLGG